MGGVRGHPLMDGGKRCRRRREGGREGGKILSLLSLLLSILLCQTHNGPNWHNYSNSTVQTEGKPRINQSIDGRREEKEKIFTPCAQLDDLQLSYVQLFLTYPFILVRDGGKKQKCVYFVQWEVLQNSFRPIKDSIQVCRRVLQWLCDPAGSTLSSCEVVKLCCDFCSEAERK